MKEWDILKLKCRNITWNQWSCSSNVLPDCLKKQDTWLVSDEKAEAAAEEVGDDGHVILQQIYAEEAAEIEHERTIMPDSEVEDVAGNVLID